MIGEKDNPGGPGPTMSTSQTSDQGLQHRIRDITGIRIHQLTLPQSLKLASKLVPESPEREEAEGYSMGGPSRLSSSPEASSSLTLSAGPGSRRARRESTSTLGTLRPVERSPSTSTSALSPVGSTFRHRGHRPRSQTLAGEALEHGQGAGSLELEQEPLVQERPLARCFVVLKLPPDPIAEESELPKSPARAPIPRRFGSQDRVRQANGTSPMRSRTSSSPPAPASEKARTRAIPSTLSSPKLKAVSRSRTGSSPGASPTAANGTDPPLPLRRPLHTLPSPRLTRAVSHRPSSDTLKTVNPTAPLPFYVSPIHRASVYPRFLTLSPRDDFAAWLSTEQAARTSFDLEVWYEDSDSGTGKWRRADELCRRVQLNCLRRRSSKDGAHPNTVEFILGHDPKSVYYLPAHHDLGDEQEVNPSEDENRSHKPSGSRTIRPRHGLNVGSLLELVNLQSVLVETEREIARVQGIIDSMLQQDVDWRAIHRDVKQRESRCAWLGKAISHVEKVTRETQAHITLHDQANDKRRTELRHAGEYADLVLGQCDEHRQSLDSVESERMETIPLIHHYQMYHAQTLDTLFPIQLLHPTSLLYTILDIPLPIPSGPKEPAPPLTISLSNLPTGYKVDERTNAAALGYASMVIQILGHFGGATSGLPYPITCAGSRSLVKDVISIMQGLRSFPLYTKGAERYRYEYAVHMLNQDLEMLMQEANIRPHLDVRQTLPNLKTLLLTLSSPESSSHQNLGMGAKTALTSRASSRQTSYTFAGYGSPGGSANGRDSPVSSRLAGTLVNSSPLSRGHGRKSSQRPIKVLSRHRGEDLEEQLRHANQEIESDDEGEKTMESDSIQGMGRRIVDT